MKPPTRPFDITEMLKDDESIAEYLTLVMEDGDPALLAATLGDIARAREALYKALRPDASPRFDTVARVCKALGVKLVAQPVVNE